MNQNGESAATPPVVIRVKQGDETQRRLFAQPENLGGTERIASLAAGALILYWFGRRLLAVAGLVALAIFLLYRGIGGYCPITAAVNRKRGRPSFSLHVQDGMAEMEPSGVENPLERERRRERQRDKIDQRSWESFPASDPPAHS
jgi:hypothetical protein